MDNYNDERRELLKLKQGLTDETELPENDIHRKPEELHGAARIKNEIYHLGWVLPVLIGAAALIIFIIVQLASRPKEDLRVLIVAASENSELYKFSENADAVKTAFEKYCADYDGNGKVYVSTVYIDLSDASGNIQYQDLEHGKFNIETTSGTAMLILSDPELLDKINEAYENEISAFIDLSNELPEDKLCNGCGARIANTGFAGDIGSGNAVLFVRDELGNGREKNSAQYRDRAVEVLKNIVGGF